jgi:DNA polymerase-3 subunit delta
MGVKAAAVRQQIASGDTAPLYVLEGADFQARLDLAGEFATVVDEALRPFNVESFHASDATSTGGRDQLITGLLAAARTLPMMAPRRVLVVHQAERLLSPRKGKDDDVDAASPSTEAGKRRKRAATPSEEFEQYLESPEPMTTIVFVAGELEENRRLVKLVRKHAITVDCGSFGTTAEAAKWVKMRLEQDGLSIEPQAISVLLDAVSHDAGRIRAEVEKLALFAADERTIRVQHVRDLISPELRPGDWRELNAILVSRNARAALREVDAQFEAGFQDIQILGMIRSVVRGLSDERAKRGLDAVFRTDLAIKTAGDPRAKRYLLESLVVELCGK